jgi:hypothetical protein
LHLDKVWLNVGMRLQNSHAITAFCLAFTIAIAGPGCSAQQFPPAPDTHILSPQSQDVNLLTARSIEPSSNSPGASPVPAYEAEYGAVRPAPHTKIADSRFFLMNGLHLGMAVIDVELTQRCIASHQCREGNPLMPSSQAGQLSMGIGFATLGSLSSYWLKKHRSQYWWLPPAGGITGHIAGVATGLRH